MGVIYKRFTARHGFAGGRRRQYRRQRLLHGRLGTGAGGGPRLHRDRHRPGRHRLRRAHAGEQPACLRDLAALELGAHYLHGRAKNDLQYHVQVSAFASSRPQHDYPTIACEAPDAGAMASLAQLHGSEDHVLFVCTALGEIGETSPGNRVRLDDSASPLAKASLHLQAGPMEQALWDLLDDATCQTIETLASRHGSKPLIEYWVGEDDDNGCWQPLRPPRAQVRLPVVVHEASTLWIGDGSDSSVVGLDYRPHGVHNVYVTGAALFPTAGSWNPTLTVCGLAQHWRTTSVEGGHQNLQVGWARP